MKARDIIVVGASAGGVETLIRLMKVLPEDIHAAIFIVLHMAPDSPGLLPLILQEHTRVPIAAAVNGEPIEQGKIYVAVPNYHLMLSADRVRVVDGPRHNRSRPAIDVLFQSAAEVFGPRVIGVVLSGMLDDGSEGLSLINQHGGYTIVQDPIDAPVPMMPRNALMRIRPHACVGVAEMGGLLSRLTREPIKEDAIMVQEASPEIRVNGAFVCPDCGGVLQELHTRDVTSFRCHVGHTFSLDGALAAQNDAVEEALWGALRALEEGAAAYEKLAAIAAERRWDDLGSRYIQGARERRQHSIVLRTTIQSALDGMKRE